jgi:hypothetical protein
LASRLKLQHAWNRIRRIFLEAQDRTGGCDTGNGLSPQAALQSWFSLLPSLVQL